METLETCLADMGHDRSLAAAALRASSNVIERAASHLAEGMLRSLQLRHKRQGAERMGDWICASLDEGGQQPDAPFLSSLRVCRQQPEWDFRLEAVRV